MWLLKAWLFNELFQKKIEQGGLRIWNFQGYQRNSMWNFHGWPIKNYVEFPGVLVFGLGICKGYNATLHNFQGWSFDLSGISRGKVNKWKIPGGEGGFKKVCPQAPLFVFFWNSSMLPTIQCCPLDGQNLPPGCLKTFCQLPP